MLAFRYSLIRIQMINSTSCTKIVTNQCTICPKKAQVYLYYMYKNCFSSEFPTKKVVFISKIWMKF